MRILCVCRAGIVRSTALASILKSNGHDVLQAGAEFNRPETLTLLSAWAERIAVMEPHYKNAIPLKHHKKVIVIDVGPDLIGPRYDATHRDLWDKVNRMWRQVVT